MKKLTLFTLLLTLIVIILGVYTRLSDAGLGCPDWPGCYGHLTVPHNVETIQAIEATYQQPVEQKKAWIEMIHRYFAGTLLLCILALAILTYRSNRVSSQPRHYIPFLLLAVVIAQALLGMWTVTLKLVPFIILLHLLGGFITLSLLWWFFLSQSNWVTTKLAFSLRTKQIIIPALILGLILLFIQIALGVITSANYAALVCPDFPYCQGQLLPAMDVNALVNIHQFAKSNPELISIHMAHRMGALITGIYLITMAIAILINFSEKLIKRIAFLLIFLVGSQITLGILNIIWLLPMANALAHTTVAALLILTLLTFLHLFSFSKPCLKQAIH